MSKGDKEHQEYYHSKSVIQTKIKWTDEEVYQLAKEVNLQMTGTKMTSVM